MTPPVIHSKVWNRKDDPDPGDNPPNCEYCMRKYAITVRIGRHMAQLCGQCIGRNLTQMREASRKRRA